ncbi:MAG: hypothetical protein A2X09_15060 [Bacteroidetes bacterium GWF2_43_11]|nr:MAG: hypothetical protein A2X09_15060 [Bacteroidetes bacterium GWF2_43_11]
MQEKNDIIANYWSENDCSASDKNFYCFPALRSRSCKLIFDEYDARRNDWGEYWTVEKYLKDKIPFKKCLSICCGFGAVERTLAKLSVVKEIIGVDIAHGAIEEARNRAKQENLNNIEYYAEDINHMDIAAEEYDLIWANGALHHIEDLENVIPRLYRSLKPGGYLISNEYVGPRYQQLSVRQQEIINSVKQLLPEDLKKTNVWNCPDIKHFLETDPSECVNSDKIIPILDQTFDEVLVRNFNGSILFYALDSAFYNNFNVNNEKHKKTLEMLFNIEDTLIDTGELKSDNAHIICTKKI